MPKKLTAWLLTGFWLVTTTLGSLAFKIPTTVSTVLIVSFLVCALVSDRFNPQSRARNSKVPTGAYVVITTVVSLQILSASFAGFDIRDRLPLFGLVLFCAALLSLIDKNQVLRGFYNAGILLAIAGWPIEILKLNSWHLESGYSSYFLGWRWMGLQSHPNLAGMTMAMIFGLALLHFRNRVVAFMCLFSLAFSEHRGGMIAVGLLLAYWTIKRFRSWAPIKKFSAAGLWSLLAVSLPQLLVARTGEDDITTGRVQIWQLCVGRIQSNSTFGLGPNAITRQFGQDTTSSLNPFHCHNQLMDDLVNFGFFGGVLPTIVVFVAAVAAVRRGNTLLIPIFFVAIACWFIESPFRLFSGEPNTFLNMLFLFALVNVYEVNLFKKRDWAQSLAHSTNII